MKASIIFCLALFITLANTHSWLACSDYASESASTWNSALCRGYGRNFYQQSAAGTFGGDGGYNFESANSNCRDPKTAGGSVTGFYNTQYPMATYYQGQRVCLAWPAKNHVAATCTNQYIEDKGLFLFRSGPNPNADPTAAQFKQNPIQGFGNGVHTNGQIDFRGYQNCSRFCQDGMDKVFCNGCFTVPTTFATGLYTMQWWWEFNGGQIYSNCFDVNVKTASECPYTDGSCQGVITTPPPGTTPPTTPPGTTPPSSDCVATCTSLCQSGAAKTCTCGDLTIECSTVDGNNLVETNSANSSFLFSALFLLLVVVLSL